MYFSCRTEQVFIQFVASVSRRLSALPYAAVVNPPPPQNLSLHVSSIQVLFKISSLLSRQADGRKVLRSSIREFLCSEAMFSLGIPTTRAGSVVTSDSRVVRDVYYSGHPRHERCSVVLRIAPTFLR